MNTQKFKRGYAVFISLLVVVIVIGMLLYIAFSIGMATASKLK